MIWASSGPGGQRTCTMPITDEEVALAAITSLAAFDDNQKRAKMHIDEILNDGNPFVDIHKLFALYNTLYFRSLLLPSVEVSWSKRLTLCAGICELVKDNQGKYRRVRLKLSEPLLKYRPREDTINTLLHEAIHAYFFITTTVAHSRGDDGTGHGSGFLLLADAINSHGSYLITVYHTFHDEVDSYRTHIWQCNGPCRTRPPYFGLVKRSMNRAPGKSDSWWQKHQEECGGAYTKIAAPELTKEQIKALSAKERAGRQKNKIDGWVKKNLVKVTVESAKRTRSLSPGRSAVAHKIAVVACPICDATVAEDKINEHLDTPHSP